MQIELHSALPGFMFYNCSIVVEKQLRVAFNKIKKKKVNWDLQRVNSCLYVTKHVFFMVYFKRINNNRTNTLYNTRWCRIKQCPWPYLYLGKSTVHLLFMMNNQCNPSTRAKTCNHTVSFVKLLFLIQLHVISIFYRRYAMN